MAARHSMFLRLWMNDAVRDVLCDNCDDETLCSLRLASHDLADAISPFLFKTLYTTFRLDSFSKPGKLETFSRIGHYVRDLHFSIEHDESTVLPALFEPDGDTSMLPWNPPRTVKAKVERSIRRPTESEELMRQWPPMFQAASNAYQFIKFFEHMPRLRGLTITTSGQDSRDLYRRSAVDFAVASIRVALDKVDLRYFRRLSLDIHPGAMVSLLATHSYVNSPRSTRLFNRVRKLKITMSSWDFQYQEKDYLKMLDHYIRAFSPTLEKLIFTWDGARGPCPLTLQSDPLLYPELDKSKHKGDHLLFGEVTTPNSPLPETPVKPEMQFRRLRSVKLQNVALTAQQLHDFFARHRESLRVYDFNSIELTDRGSFEYAVAPLLHLDDKTSRWPANVSSCNQSFNDSGYESPGSHIGSTSPIDGPANNLWAGITDDDLFDDATPGMEYKAKPKIQEIKDEQPPVIITAKHEKRRVKRRRRMHPKELAAKASRAALAEANNDAQSRIMFDASELSLKSPITTGPPKISEESLHPPSSHNSTSRPLYGAVGDICLSGLQQPETLHPAMRVGFSFEAADEPTTPRALSSMRSAPVLLQPTVFSPSKSNIALPDVPPTPRRASDTPMLLKPAVFDPSAPAPLSPKTPRSPVYSYPPAAPRPTNLSTPCSSIYSPLFPSQTPHMPTFADVLDTPTPPPLNFHRPAHPPPMSPLLSPNANPFRPATKWPGCVSLTASAIMTNILPPPPSAQAPSFPHHLTTATDDCPPPTPPKNFTKPKNPLVAAAHLSLVTDPVRCDSAIKSGKEAVIANFANKYSELSSQPSQASISTLSSFGPVEVKGTLGRSISNRLNKLNTNLSNLSPSTSPVEVKPVSAVALPIEEEKDGLVTKAGTALKKGFKAFLHRRIYGPDDEPIPAPEPIHPRRLQRREEREKERDHGHSRSQSAPSNEQPPTSDTAYSHRRRHRRHRTDDPTSTRHRRQRPTTPPTLTTSASLPALQSSPPRPILERSHTAGTTIKTTTAASTQNLHPASVDRPGHGIEEAYRRLQARRAAEAEKDRLQLALEAEVRNELMQASVRDEDEMINMVEAWGPPPPPLQEEFGCYRLGGEGKGEGGRVGSWCDEVILEEDEEGDVPFVVYR